VYYNLIYSLFFQPFQVQLSIKNNPFRDKARII